MEDDDDDDDDDDNTKDDEEEEEEEDKPFNCCFEIFSARDDALTSASTGTRADVPSEKNGETIMSHQNPLLCVERPFSFPST